MHVIEWHGELSNPEQGEATRKGKVPPHMPARIAKQIDLVAGAARAMEGVKSNEQDEDNHGEQRRSHAPVARDE